MTDTKSQTLLQRQRRITQVQHPHSSFFRALTINGCSKRESIIQIIGHPEAMLTKIYIEALLVDEELADQVWEAWHSGEIDEATAFLAWWLLAEYL